MKAIRRRFLRKEDEMDRRDLKEGQEVYVKGRVIHTGDHLDIVLDKGSFIENAIILHHEKPVVPQFVADIIEEYKDRNAPIIDIFTEKKFNEKYNWWLATSLNAYDRTARAWLDGYEVEKEKLYTVKIKNTDDHLVKTNNDDYHFYNSIYTQNRKHTRKELEDAGFGWCFSCEGIEVQEMEE